MSFKNPLTFPVKPKFKFLAPLLMLLALTASFFSNDAFAINLGGIAAGYGSYQEGVREGQGQQPSKMEDASQRGNEDAGGGYRRCSYETMRGFNFSINVKGSFCPYSVKVNPETMQVLKP